MKLHKPFCLSLPVKGEIFAAPKAQQPINELIS